eukprot:3997053-Heterocapsa_arctica.AAC.1
MSPPLPGRRRCQGLTSWTATLPGIEETCLIALHERIGRWPIRMHDIVPQHRSRGPRRRRAH